MRKIISELLTWEALLKLMAFILFIGTIGLIFFISNADLSSRESAMLGTLLTIVSILTGLIITHFYAKAGFNQNLKVYGRKASEKVDNLSNELSKLAIYLQSELDDSEDDIPEKILHSREERMESAIHIINTLKSINDKSLSDWEGVIGEELHKKREEQKENEEEFKQIVYKLGDVEEMSHDDSIISDVKTEELLSEINDLKKKVNIVASSLVGFPIKSRRIMRTRKEKEDVESQCPSCNQTIRYKQRPLINSEKKIICKQCSEELIGRWDPNLGFKLIIDLPQEEIINCSSCGNQNRVLLGLSRGSKNSLECEGCNIRLNLTREIKGNVEIEVKEISKDTVKTEILDEAIKNKIKELLPPQPWPTGTARQIANELDLNLGFVHKIINLLIEEGAFKMQINGVLYVPATDTKQQAG